MNTSVRAGFLLLMVLFTASSCKKEEVAGVYFPPERLMSLKIDNLPAFWDEDPILSVSNYVIECFKLSPGYMGAIRYSSAQYNLIAVSVFETPGFAINAMQARSDNLPGVYMPGDTIELHRMWWYTADADRGMFNVYVNVLNTIAEIHYYYDDAAEGRRLVMQTAETLIARIENKSE